MKKTAINLNKIFEQIAYEIINGHPTSKRKIFNEYLIIFSSTAGLFIFLFICFPSMEDLIMFLKITFPFLFLLVLSFVASLFDDPESDDIKSEIMALKEDYQKVASIVSPEEFATKALALVRRERMENLDSDIETDEEGKREVIEKYGLDTSHYKHQRRKHEIN